MGFNRIKAVFPALALAIAMAGAVAAAPSVSKTSVKAVRLTANPAITVVPGFTAAAVSTTSLQWSWSTGSFTGSGLTGYKLYTSSAAGAYIPLTLNTSHYIDTGLEANKAYTRWLTVYDATEEGSDTEHLQKYTYAVPPATIAISSDAPTAAPTVNSLALPWARLTDTVISTSAYVEIPPAYWFPNPVYSSAYLVECSTDGGDTYVRNRAFFVPWNTFPVLSNQHYMIRVGALNGDEELTPGIYSATRTFTTPPLTPPDFTAVAISSYSIQWRWDKDVFADTGIASFRVYRSSQAEDGTLPAEDDDGEVVTTLPPNTSYWTEVYVDSGTALTANSRHTRWVKAVGFLESDGARPLQKYTYGIAPGSTTVVWLEDPFWVVHVGEESLTLNWPTVDVSTAIFGDTWRPAIATQYVIDSSTVPGFTVAVASAIVGGPPQSVLNLTDNTKYDLRIGAVNGDGEQTPDNALNPYAYSQTYKVMTRPSPPSNYACGGWTDTAMHCAWSTATYVNASYIEGYSLGKLRVCPVNGKYVNCWDPLDTLAGVASNEYNLDYLETNSTHTISIWVNQQDPAWVAGNAHYDATPKEWQHYYNNYGSYRLDTNGYTFATPPNDVSFDTVTARTIGVWWRHPEVPATSYRIERATSAKESGPWVFVSSAAGTTYEDSGLSPLTTYTYRIGAINLLGVQTIGLSTATNGQRRDYSFISSTVTKHTSPAMYGVAYGTSAMSWSWSDSTPGVLSYNIYDSTYGVLTSGLAAASTFWLETTLPGSNTRYTRHIASLRAETGVGELAEASAVTLAEAPTALAASSTDVHRIAIAWTGNKGTRYKVDRSPDGGVWTGLKTWADAVSTQTLTDAGLHAAATYYYAVRSYNQDGIVSVSSAVSVAIRTLDLPATVTQVFSTATAAQTLNATLPGLGTLAVTIPAGALSADNYVAVSTSAATAPAEVSKTDLDAATAKLGGNSLLPGGVIELRRYDMYGALVTGNFASPASVVFTYLDANTDGVVDGTTVDEGTLRVFSLNTSALEWTPQRSSVLDRLLKTVSLDTSHFSIYALGSLVSVAGDISEVFAYPNPYKPGSAGSFGNSAFGAGIIFESLPAGSTIRIFNVAGGLVREISDDDRDGRAVWDARNSGGTQAASGVYLYLVSGPDGGKKSGRVAIIR